MSSDAIFVCQNSAALSMVRQPLPINAVQKKNGDIFFKPRHML